MNKRLWQWQFKASINCCWFIFNIHSCQAKPRFIAAQGFFGCSESGQSGFFPPANLPTIFAKISIEALQHTHTQTELHHIFQWVFILCVWTECHEWTVRWICVLRCVCVCVRLQIREVTKWGRLSHIIQSHEVAEYIYENITGNYSNNIFNIALKLWLFSWKFYMCICKIFMLWNHIESDFPSH